MSEHSFPQNLALYPASHRGSTVLLRRDPTLQRVEVRVPVALDQSALYGIVEGPARLAPFTGERCVVDFIGAAGPSNNGLHDFVVAPLESVKALGIPVTRS